MAVGLDVAVLEGPEVEVEVEPQFPVTLGTASAPIPMATSWELQFAA